MILQPCWVAAMLEHEPHRPNYDELKKAHEAAIQPQASNQPNHEPRHPNYNDLKVPPPEPKRERDEAKPPQHEPVNVIDDTEAKMATHREELQIEFEAGRIDKHEQIRR